MGSCLLRGCPIFQIAKVYVRERKRERERRGQVVTFLLQREKMPTVKEEIIKDEDSTRILLERILLMHYLIYLLRYLGAMGTSYSNDYLKQRRMHYNEIFFLVNVLAISQLNF